MVFTAILVGSLVVSVGAVLGYALFSWLSWTYSEELDIPFIPTPFYSLELVAEKLQIQKGDVVYDIGCGDGRLLFYCSKKYPDTKFVGIERNPALLIWMRLRKFMTAAHNVEIRDENIFTADISDATKIYAFLLQHLTDRFFRRKEFTGVRVVSRAFPISYLKPVETFRVTPHDISYGGHMAYVYDL